MPRRPRRRTFSLLGALAAVVVLFLGIAIPLYGFPPQAEPGKSDAIFVIGPPNAWRIILARQMIEDGLSDTLVISVTSEDSVPECYEPQSFTVICGHPEPFTTRGESRYLADLMQENGWNTATVITATPHIVRTRVLMDRCVPDGGVSVIGRSDGLDIFGWVYQFAYQTGAFVKVFLNPDC